jgi:hypothetical protein
MRARFEHILSTALLMALTLVLAPSLVSAQDAVLEQAAQCIATVDPAEVPAGQAAVQLNATLSEDIGAVAGFEGPQDSNLKLADPADIPRVDMAAEEEARPIVMTPETNSVSIWLSTAESTPGTYEATLTSEAGTCSASITVVPASN